MSSRQIYSQFAFQNKRWIFENVLVTSGHFTRLPILDNFPGHAATFASSALPTPSILSESYEEH